MSTDDWRHALSDETWAARNSNAQILLTGLALSAWGQLTQRVATPSVIAGYSVGELAAFSAAGVFGPETALDLAEARAKAMDECAARCPGGLLAISGLSEVRLQRIIIESGLEPAIRIGRGTMVLGGPETLLAKATRLALHEGAQCTRLRVSVASHTPWMHEASASFAHTLASVPMCSPKVFLFSYVAKMIRNSPPSTVLDDGDERQAETSTTCWSSAKEMRHARPSQ